MDIVKFIAIMLVLIFIALSWRFLLILGAIALAIFLWGLIFAFIKGVVQAIKEEGSS